MGPVAGNLSSSKPFKGAEKHQMGLNVMGATNTGVTFGLPPISRTQRVLVITV